MSSVMSVRNSVHQSVKEWNTCLIMTLLLKVECMSIMQVKGKIHCVSECFFYQKILIIPFQYCDRTSFKLPKIVRLITRDGANIVGKSCPNCI